ncbi:MAG TPA: hypothetical protein VFB06_11630 [Streptosporangiaceae bacterium]|nr:hypothetical protein [Streptosporangiaceae bacterium]
MASPENEPGPAPELAAAMAETRIYRDLLAEVLRQFEDDPYRSGLWIARVPAHQVRKWRELSGIREWQ